MKNQHINGSSSSGKKLPYFGWKGHGIGVKTGLLTLAVCTFAAFSWWQLLPVNISNQLKSVTGSLLSVQNLIGWHYTGATADLSEPVVCVCPTAMNVLYTGIHNPVNFAVSGVPAEEVSIRINENAGRIGKDSSGYYAVVYKPGDVYIHVKFRQDGKIRERDVKFRAMPFPEPELMWGEEHVVTEVVKSNEALASQNRLVMSYGRGFPFDIQEPTVRSYQFIFQPKYGPAIVRRVNGDSIPMTIQEKIRSAQSEDRFIMDMIRISGPGGDKPINPFFIELKRVEL